MVLLEISNVVIKRKHTDLYPEVRMNPHAILRNKIVSHLGSCDNCRQERTEFVSFLKSLENDEEIGRYSKSYHSKNKDIIDTIKVGGNHYVKLNKIGRKRYKYLQDNG